jgi:hypothetical protein
MLREERMSERKRKRVSASERMGGTFFYFFMLGVYW